MILVDTSVIVDILTKDAAWFGWSSAQIEHWANRGPVCYDTIVFAELAVKFDTQKELEHRLSAFTYLPLPLNTAFQAGKAFEKYRRTGGKKARPLPDFFIGAHSYVSHLPLLTRDPGRVSSFFPSVQLVTPLGGSQPVHEIPSDRH